MVRQCIAKCPIVVIAWSAWVLLWPATLLVSPLLAQDADFGSPADSEVPTPADPSRNDRTPPNEAIETSLPAAPPTEMEFLPRLTDQEQAIAGALRSEADLEFSDEPLALVLQSLEELADIPIQIDRLALEAAGIDPSEPITFTRRGIPLHSGLSLLLRDLDLTWTVVNDVLLITTREESAANPTTRTYPVSDLCRDTADLCSLTHTVTSNVEPDSWENNGGAATITSYPASGVLVISHTYQSHDEVLELLRSLRQARQFGSIKPGADSECEPQANYPAAVLVTEK